MFSRAFAAIATMCALTACGMVDTMTDGFKHSKAVSAELDKTLGLKSFVGFNWHNGNLTSVNVTFQGIPANANLTDIADKAKVAVVNEFKQTPKQVVIAFTIEP